MPFQSHVMVQNSYWKSAPGTFFLVSEAVGDTNPCGGTVSIMPRILQESCGDRASGSVPERSSKAKATAGSSSARRAALPRAGIPDRRDPSWAQLPSPSSMMYLDGSVLISLHIIHGGFQASDINSFLLLWHFNPMCNFLPFWVLSKTHKLTCVSTSSAYISYSLFTLLITSPYPTYSSSPFPKCLTLFTFREAITFSFLLLF